MPLLHQVYDFFIPTGEREEMDGEERDGGGRKKRERDEGGRKEEERQIEMKINRKRWKEEGSEGRKEGREEERENII